MLFLVQAPTHSSHFILFGIYPNLVPGWTSKIPHTRYTLLAQFGECSVASTETSFAVTILGEIHVLST